MDRGAWQATDHGVAKSQTWLSDFTSLHFKEAEEFSQTFLTGMPHKSTFFLLKLFSNMYFLSTDYLIFTPNSKFLTLIIARPSPSNFLSNNSSS